MRTTPTAHKWACFFAGVLCGALATIIVLHIWPEPPADEAGADREVHTVSPSTSRALPVSELEVPVIRTVDGDTIKVTYRGKEESVRFLCINTPERGKPGYRQATEALRKLIGCKPVRLEFDGAKEQRDRFGRLLGYVWRDDLNLNVEMVRLGHTPFWTKYGRGKYAAEFEEAERQARSGRQTQ